MQQEKRNGSENLLWKWRRNYSQNDQNMNVKQIIMGIKDELDKAENCLIAEHPDIAVDHLRNIKNNLQNILPNEDSKLPKQSQRTTDQSPIDSPRSNATKSDVRRIPRKRGR